MRGPSVFQACLPSPPSHLDLPLGGAVRERGGGGSVCERGGGRVCVCRGREGVCEGGGGRVCVCVCVSCNLESDIKYLSLCACPPSIPLVLYENIQLVLYENIQTI